MLLLSSYGELLIAKRADAVLKGVGEISCWQAIIAGLGRPQVADLLFERGRYYLCRTDLGYIIVGMKNTISLNKVKTACKTVREKLCDSVIRKRVLLKMLKEADEPLKPHVVKALALGG